MNKLMCIFLFFCINYAYAQVDSPKEIRREKAYQKTGDILQLALPVGAGLTTLFVKDEEGFWQLMKSYGTTIAITYGVKYLINKPRPEGASDGLAFPSGHTASAFSGASFIQRRYGWTYGAPAYALAGFVAYSRIEGYNDRHDGWDVLAGAIVGIGSTYIFTTPYQRDHYELTFSSDNDVYLLGIKYKF
ncbi:MAG: phosphatase PAP2 family protein [Altibacter sp.]|uniref:phosphatase PAP2 family protein n=1 Tax=Altibacter sp. TaxID=2024823 RepID=UPI001E090515|nr:phosphatase PAP2 family protein [Altibacter sp.]MBZ0327858.1 phosphatase PAP2 family protein [Altibacter sp.]